MSALLAADDVGERGLQEAPTAMAVAAEGAEAAQSWGHPRRCHGRMGH